MRHGIPSCGEPRWKGTRGADGGCNESANKPRRGCVAGGATAHLADGRPAVARCARRPALTASSRRTAQLRSRTAFATPTPARRYYSRRRAGGGRGPVAARRRRTEPREAQGAHGHQRLGCTRRPSANLCRTHEPASVRSAAASQITAKSVTELSAAAAAAVSTRGGATPIGLRPVRVRAKSAHELESDGMAQLSAKRFGVAAAAHTH